MRNLLSAPWLLFRMRDGSTSTLPFSAIVRGDIVDIALPREDFSSAAYQLLVAVLQTAFAPADDMEWGDYFNAPPSEELLQERFRLIEHAFDIDTSGPAFMQDFDLLEDAKPTTVAGLLIDAPGENAIKRNTDHFVKRGVGEVMSPAMAVLALWTLQINAPAGGAGHRVGLRGGGPLTVLVTPGEPDAPLWHKLWLNVVNRQVWNYNDPDFQSPDVFPWLGPTRTSEKKGSEVYLHDIHPLQMYWSMPRRIRLIIEDKPAVCAISGVQCDRSVRFYRTQNYGINYSGNWDHPLTPYRWDPKKPNADELSLKGQPGGLNYKIWDVLVFSSSKFGQRCSRNVDHYHEIFDELDMDSTIMPRLWVSGFDMDNMKARGWHSAYLPFFTISADQQDDALRTIRELQELTNIMLWHCRSKIKSAWFERPGDAKGDMTFVDTRFWQRTESVFFNVVQQILSDEHYELTSLVAQHWLQVMRRICCEIFDEYAFTELGDVRSMSKRVNARGHLVGWLYGGKEIKAFIENYQVEPLMQQEGVTNE